MGRVAGWNVELEPQGGIVFKGKKKFNHNGVLFEEGIARMTGGVRIVAFKFGEVIVCLDVYTTNLLERRICFDAFQTSVHKFTYDFVIPEYSGGPIYNNVCDFIYYSILPRFSSTTTQLSFDGKK